MCKIFYILFIISFLITSCVQNTEIKNKMEVWIQSIENKDFSSYQKDVLRYPDSVYNSFRNLDLVLEPAEFSFIKKINLSSNHKIDIDKIEALKLPFIKKFVQKDTDHFRLSFVPLDTLNPFKYYIVMVDFNSDWEKPVLFFSKNHCLGEYKVKVKSILEAIRFDKQTLIVGQVFQSGTGLYWLQNHFFRLSKNRVFPVLQTVSSSYQVGWGCLDFVVNSKIISKHPLKIAYEKEFEFRDSTNQIINKIKYIDRILFDWNKNKSCYQPSVKFKNKYNKLVSFYVGSNIEFLIKANINSFKPLLKTERGLLFLNQLYKQVNK